MRRPLCDHNELREKIRALEELAKASEDFLLYEGRKTLAVLSDPAPFIKNQARKLAGDKDFRKDLFKIGLRAGLNSLEKLISSPAAGDALLSFILKKTSHQEHAGTGKLWKYMEKLLDKLKPGKHQQA